MAEFDVVLGIELTSKDRLERALKLRIWATIIDVILATVCDYAVYRAFIHRDWLLPGIMTMVFGALVAASALANMYQAGRLAERLESE